MTPRAIPNDGNIVRAAQWMADLPRLPNGLRRQLRERFCLDTDQIAQAVDLAAKMVLNRKVYG